MKVEILDLAREDLIAGFEFYEFREAGIGEHFLTCLIRDIEALESTGGTHSQPHGGYYRALSEVFPFAIYYSVESETVRIRAIVDCRRDPECTQSRLNAD